MKFVAPAVVLLSQLVLTNAFPVLTKADIQKDAPEPDDKGWFDFGPRSTGERCGILSTCEDGLQCSDAIFGNRCLPKDCFAETAKDLGEKFDTEGYLRDIFAKAGVSKEDIKEAEKNAKDEEDFENSGPFRAFIATLQANPPENLQSYKDAFSHCGTSFGRRLEDAVGGDVGAEDNDGDGTGPNDNIVYVGLHLELGLILDGSFTFYWALTDDADPLFHFRFCIGGELGGGGELSFIVGIAFTKEVEDLEGCSIHSDLPDAGFVAVTSMGVAYDFSGIWELEFTFGAGVGLGVGLNWCITVRCDDPSSSVAPSISSAPSSAPTELPSKAPTGLPSAFPTGLPSASPTDLASASPTDLPSASPTDLPSASPTDLPSASPTDLPSAAPIQSPSAAPTQSPAPSQSPSAAPSAAPTQSPEIIEFSATTIAGDTSFGTGAVGTEGKKLFLNGGVDYDVITEPVADNNEPGDGGNYGGFGTITPGKSITPSDPRFIDGGYAGCYQDITLAPDPDDSSKRLVPLQYAGDVDPALVCDAADYALCTDVQLSLNYINFCRDGEGLECFGNYDIENPNDPENFIASTSEFQGDARDQRFDTDGTSLSTADGRCCGNANVLYSMITTERFFPSKDNERVFVKWQPVGTGDWFEVLAVLYEAEGNYGQNCGVDAMATFNGEPQATYLRGAEFSDFTTIEFVAPDQNKDYFLAFYHASYDATGGQFLGSKLVVDNFFTSPDLPGATRRYLRADVHHGPYANPDNYKVMADKGYEQV